MAYMEEKRFLEDLLQQKSQELTQLSQNCLKLKQSLWEAEAHRQYLQSRCQTISTSLDSEKFFTDLKSKYEFFKGTTLEKVLLGLIRAYQQYKTHTVSLSVFVNEKEETLSRYKKVTSALSHESNLKAKLKSLQDFLEEKELNANGLKKKLIETRNEANELKERLDFGEVKKCFERIEEVKEESEKVKADQSLLQIELQNIEQKIEKERVLGGAKTEDVNKMLKGQIREVEKRVTGAVQEIKVKERKLGKVKILQTNLESGRKSMNATPVSRGKSELGLRANKSLVISPDAKGSQRNSVITMLRSGIDHRNFGKIDKVMKSVGNGNESFTSKIVLLNRGSYFS